MDRSTHDVAVHPDVRDLVRLAEFVPRPGWLGRSPPAALLMLASGRRRRGAAVAGTMILAGSVAERFRRAARGPPSARATVGGETVLGHRQPVMRRPPGIYDPAAQLERTALAWSRASVAILANGALLVRAGLVYNLALLTAAGLAAATVGAAPWTLSGTHYSALAGRRVGHLLAGRPRAVFGLTAFVTLLSVIALITTLVR